MRFRDPSGDKKFTWRLEYVDGVDQVNSRTARAFNRHAKKCRGKTGDFNFEVYLAVHVPQATQDAVGAALNASPSVTNVRFVSKHDAFQIFKCMFEDRPDLVHNINASSLPASFQVAVIAGTDVEAFQAQIEALRGVSEVAIQSPPEPAGRVSA